jgi:calcium/calmodulin-dependent protein kinase I
MVDKVLVVKLIEGKALAIRDRSGTSDPYVVLRIGKQKTKSKVIKKNLDPKWDQIFTFHFDNVKDRLRLEVFDHDVFTKDDYMGFAELSLEEIEEGATEDKWLKLQDVEKGEIHITVSLNPNVDKNKPKPSSKIKGEIIGHYTVTDTLGSGSFSTVKKAYDRVTENVYAIKIIDKKKFGAKKEELAMIQTEIEIMRMIEHPNIISLHEVFEDKTTKKIYLVMELVTGGELFDRIVEKGSYSEKDASELISKVISAVRYLHKKGIIHRDLKPENLLYSSPDEDAEIKLADFGLSKIVGLDDESAVTNTTCGTPGYVAPEVLRMKGYDRSVDMWSIGVILYILLCGFPPFYEENTAKLFQTIMDGKYDFPDPEWTSISESAKDLIQRMLTVDSKKRITADEALEHPWILGHTAKDEKLSNDVIDKIRRSQKARQRLKGAIRAVMMGNKLNMLGAHKDGDSETPTTDSK